MWPHGARWIFGCCRIFVFAIIWYFKKLRCYNNRTFLWRQCGSYFNVYFRYVKSVLKCLMYCFWSSSVLFWCNVSKKFKHLHFRCWKWYCSSCKYIQFLDIWVSLNIIIKWGSRITKRRNSRDTELNIYWYNVSTG